MAEIHHQQDRQAVEFIGGPYDGFSHVLARYVEGLAEEIAVPVSQNLI